MRYIFILPLFFVQSVFALGGVYTSLSEALANPASAENTSVEWKEFKSDSEKH
jgi:hypothetical protein